MARASASDQPSSILTLGVGLAGLLVIGGCSSRPNVANLDSQGTAIICFGDSLTQGVGASPGHEYPSLLGGILGREVINAGVGGETTADALRRLDADVLEKNPRLVIVELGGNDFLQQLPVQDTFANLETIVRRIQEHGAMVVLVGVSPGLLADTTRGEYEQVARARRAAFVPNILAGILADPTLKSDGIHPNDSGYEKIAQRIARAIRPLLDQ